MKTGTPPLALMQTYCVSSSRPTVFFVIQTHLPTSRISAPVTAVPSDHLNAFLITLKNRLLKLKRRNVNLKRLELELKKRVIQDALSLKFSPHSRPKSTISTSHRSASHSRINSPQQSTFQVTSTPTMFAPLIEDEGSKQKGVPVGVRLSTSRYSPRQVEGMNRRANVCEAKRSVMPAI